GGGKTCGNKKLDDGEKCDGTLLGGKNCNTATMGAKTGGTLACKSDCSDFDTSKCTAGSTGGSGGAGGATGGSGNAGSGGSPGGAGGTKGKDAGGPDATTPDAAPDTGVVTEAGKPDSGGSKPDATTPTKDAAKD